ncbi:MAG: Stp1/IreP family PP2C-type Ser/Thr phosphatase [Firmicutes bacterium]|nr:Stp1/IreP family PP2C-type Ser/Thr phosphatase [Bacillota bacterium]
MDVGFKTDKGIKRSNNEDAFFVMKNDGIYIVADGVGGNRSGEIASRTAVSEIARYIEQHALGNRESEIKNFFLNAFHEANHRVIDAGRRFEENSGMATTCVLAYFHGSEMYVVNVGDSRAYLLTGGRLCQITEDHTYVNALVKAGIITPEQAVDHSDKNMITRAIGADVVIEPDVFKVRIKPGDRVLLCTDGLYGELSAQEITEIFGQGLSMTDTCVALVDAANDAGGCDNITAVCIAITEDDVR